jgi:hypothetical protein
VIWTKRTGLYKFLKTPIANMDEGIEVKPYEFEYWSSLDQRNVIITIMAESEKDAIKEFKNRHPHKKYRLLDPLDD